MNSWKMATMMMMTMMVVVAMMNFPQRQKEMTKEIK